MIRKLLKLVVYTEWNIKWNTISLAHSCEIDFKLTDSNS